MLESGTIASIIRHQVVDAGDWGYVSYQVDGAKKRIPVDGWATLD
jgi:hypothetical protein